uniref:Uncharacterized transmembrane protein DDB_G0289901-like isoform X1 n=1 Tax=Crassostrea virginica TaxID=6565 RepID=A0A8B8C1P7_CRAVI|nr:uncharacterized transmembrane protein DDB_G0289901-like isoform X1 [Crassostrea virginica]
MECLNLFSFIFLGGFTLVLSQSRGQNMWDQNMWGQSSGNPSWDPNPHFSNSGGGGGGQSGNSGWSAQSGGSSWSNPSSNPSSQSSSNAMLEAASMAAMMGLGGMGGGSNSAFGGLGGMGGLGAMSGMMNPMSLMLNMQARSMGDNFNPNPPEVVYTANQCPAFTSFRQCHINPCPLRCKRFPTARCVTNPCGGCAPEWYQGGNRIVDCD